MPDWPKHHLEKATHVTIEDEVGHIHEMDGPTFVRCLESGGWRQIVDVPHSKNVFDEHVKGL